MIKLDGISLIINHLPSCVLWEIYRRDKLIGLIEMKDSSQQELVNIMKYNSFEKDLDWFAGFVDILFL